MEKKEKCGDSQEGEQLSNRCGERAGARFLRGETIVSCELTRLCELLIWPRWTHLSVDALSLPLHPTLPFQLKLAVIGQL